MKHLPFNHSWQVLSYSLPRVPASHSIFPDYYTVTELNLFCFCGKTKAKHIANYEMQPEHIKTYVDRVYG